VTENGKPFYHNWTLGSFELCAYCLYLRKIEKRAGLGNLYSCRGVGSHFAREINLRQKIETRKDLDLNVLQDAARDKVSELVEADKVDLKSEELIGMSKKAAAAKIIDSTVKLVKVDRQFLLPQIQPLEVEVRTRIDLPQWPFGLDSRLDCITPGIIRDFKTSIRRWTQEKADSEYQPSIYTLQYRARNGKDPDDFIYDCLQYLKSGPRAYSVSTKRTETQIIAVLNRIEIMHKQIQAGLFPPQHKDHWKCSARWCRYWRADCKYVSH